jgi:hypothetical protein
MNGVQYRVAESIPRGVRVPASVRTASSVRVASGIGVASGVRVASGVGVTSGVCVVSGVELRSVSPASQFWLRQSPRMALGPTLRGLKRAAEAKRFERIAGRLAALAGAGHDSAVRLGPGKQAGQALFKFKFE